MRHGKVLRKFGRTPSHRRAMFRNLATSLLLNEKCETTVHKAKDLRRVVEKLITLAGTDSLHRRRKALGYIQKKAVVHKLFTELGPRYKARPGGYTRVLRTRRREGDAAEMAVIELIQEEAKSAAAAEEQKTSRKKKASSKKTDAAQASTKKTKAKASAKEGTEKSTTAKKTKKESADKKAAKKKSKKETE
jgi:large subunit ribosomal protein L17